MNETIWLRLVEEGELAIEVDRAEYEAAKAADRLVDFLGVYASDIPPDWWIVEPGNVRVNPVI
jgi:hypothetical protein